MSTKRQKFWNTTRESSNLTDICFGSTTALPGFRLQKQLISSLKPELILRCTFSPASFKITVPSKWISNICSPTIPNTSVSLFKSSTLFPGESSCTQSNRVLLQSCKRAEEVEGRSALPLHSATCLWSVDVPAQWCISDFLHCLL